jgi:transposase
MIPASVRIFLCTEPVDMRLGFDRLARVAKERVGIDPISGGALFVFSGRSATRLKVLWFDHNGLCMLYKRLHKAVFEMPSAEGAVIHIDTAALAQLLAGKERITRKRKNNCSNSN